jgi:hypothetical protein
MSEETAIIGWKAIANYLQWTTKKAISRRKEWMEAGIIFYSIFGKPPNRHKRVCCFPSMIQRWTVIKTRNGELL